MAKRMKVTLAVAVSALMLSLAACSSTPVEEPEPTPEVLLNEDLVLEPTGNEVITEPGTVIPSGGSIVREVAGFDGESKAIVETKIASAGVATPEESAAISQTYPTENMTLSIIKLEHKKLSGGSVSGVTEYENFMPQTADGFMPQTIPAYDVPGCNDTSFSIEFDKGEAPIVTCIVVIADPTTGEAPITGVNYTGQAGTDNPFQTSPVTLSV